MKIFKRIYNKLIARNANDPKNYDQYVFDANTRYDLQTFKIISQLAPEANAIDIGAHKGDILVKIIEAAPQGKHFAFEPIPDLYAGLAIDFKNKATIYPYALGNSTGKMSFNLVLSNPAYSGLLKREYDRPEEDTLIDVEVKRLDDVIPADQVIHLIKIDVEGAEFGVLKGAEELLRRCKPIIIYEQGLGASEIYGTDPGIFFDFMISFGYKISLMEYYIMNKEPLSREEYCGQFWKAYNYYFIAY